MFLTTHYMGGRVL